jgi:hypothetical protein
LNSGDAFQTATRVAFPARRDWAHDEKLDRFFAAQLRVPRLLLRCGPYLHGEAVSARFAVGILPAMKRFATFGAAPTMLIVDDVPPAPSSGGSHALIWLAVLVLVVVAVAFAILR